MAKMLRALLKGLTRGHALLNLKMNVMSVDTRLARLSFPQSISHIFEEKNIGGLAVVAEKATQCRLPSWASYTLG